MPSFPTTVSVGQTAVAAQLQIANSSSGVGSVTLSQITLNPACGDVTVSCDDPDLGVLQLSPTATGSGGSCSGRAFTISAPDANGRSLFVPALPVVLQPSGTNAECFIDFTFDVLKAPTTDADPEADLQTRQFATTAGSAVTSSSQTLFGDDEGTSITTVGLRQPSVSTLASGPVMVGSPIFDTATLTEGQNPTGLMTFLMYGPDVPDCPGVASEGPPVRVSPRQPVVVPDFVSNKPVDGNGDYVSDPYIPTQPGLYRWYAFYSGDDNNYATNPACEDHLEEVDVAEGPVTTTTSSTTTSTTSTTLPTGGTTTTIPPVVGPPTTRRPPPVLSGPLAETGPDLAIQIGFALLLVAVGAHIVLGTWRGRGGF